MNKGGFSWKRATGVTRAKQKVARSTGIPLTKSGRQRKAGKLLTGGGCLLPTFGLALVLVAAACGAPAATAAPTAPVSVTPVPAVAAATPDTERTRIYLTYVADIDELTGIDDRDQIGDFAATARGRISDDQHEAIVAWYRTALDGLLVSYAAGGDLSGHLARIAGLRADFADLVGGVPTPVLATASPSPEATTIVTPPPPPPTPTSQPAPTEVYYANCAEVRAAGAAPLRRGQPGYRTGLDRDGDGVACE